MSTFPSPISFQRDHADSLALYCSDGRFARQCEEFLAQHLKWTNCDRFIVPGGAAWLLLDAMTFHEYDAARSKIGLLVAAHPIQRAVLIAHEDCGFYRAKFPQSSDEEILQQQIEDLQQAAFTLSVWFSHLTIATYYARIIGGRVVFERIE